MSGTNVNRIKNKKVQRNNTSGYTGVIWHSRIGKWTARITFKGKTYNLGYFDDVEKAIAKRKAMEEMTFDRFIKAFQEQKTIKVK